jgi:hypothetical protein
MQTFLPYNSCHRSAKALDWRRLGKQRVEAYQILNILTGKTQKKGWVNHPAVKMWCGYEYGLKFYANEMIMEWQRRGYKNTMEIYDIPDTAIDTLFPPWFGDEKFHASHRSNLLRKDPVYYGQFGWTEPQTLEYVWPVTK